MADATNRRHSTGASPASTVVDQEAQAVLAIAEDLRRQLEHSTEMIQALREDLAATRDLQKRAEGLAGSRARELEQVKGEAASAQQSNERLVIELGASEEERAEAIKEIRHLVATLDATNATVRSLEEQQQRQSRDADEARRAAEGRETRLKGTVGELEEKLQNMERGLEQRTKDLDQAHALIDQLSDERDALEKRVADLEQSRLALGKIHTSLSDIRSKLLGDPDSRAQRPVKTGAAVE